MRKINAFQFTMIAVVTSLMPLLELLIFVARYHEEERLNDFLWSTLTCQTEI